MTLTDTGPLVAPIDRRDPHHGLCRQALEGLPAGPAITTWPCFTEAMYLLHRAGCHPAQAEFWRWRSTARLLLHEWSGEAMDRMAFLMAKYQDTPMDLADASLAATASKAGRGRSRVIAIGKPAIIPI